MLEGRSGALVDGRAAFGGVLRGRAPDDGSRYGVLVDDAAGAGRGLHGVRPARGRLLLRGLRQCRTTAELDEPEPVPELAVSLLFLHVLVEVVQDVV